MKEKILIDYRYWKGVNEFIENINEKIYCTRWNKYRNFKVLISCIFHVALVLSIICDKCGIVVLIAIQYLKRKNLLKFLA